MRTRIVGFVVAMMDLLNSERSGGLLSGLIGEI